MRRKAVARLVQRTFDDLLRKRRKGGGRKKSPDSGGSHRKRPRVTARTPVLITLKVRDLLPVLRKPEAYRVIRKALEKACRRPGRRQEGGFRIVDFAEATDNDSLSSGINGLCRRMAKGLNRLWLRSGKVFADRYHMRVLRTPREVYNAKRYVYENARKHLLPNYIGRPDP